MFVEFINKLIILEFEKNKYNLQNYVIKPINYVVTQRYTATDLVADPCHACLRNHGHQFKQKYLNKLPIITSIFFLVATLGKIMRFS